MTMEGLKKPVLIVDAFASEANSPSLPLRDLDVQRVLEAMGAMRGLSGDASTALLKQSYKGS